MVCLGNICRSPMAHGLLKHKADAMGLGWEVDSAGTSDWHRGELPDERAIACMKKHGIDITYQRSRPFIRDDYNEFDLIYVMDNDNYDKVIGMARSEEEMQKVKLLLYEMNPISQIEVPDPYFGGDAGFEHVYKLLDKATNRVIEKYAPKTVDKT